MATDGKNFSHRIREKRVRLIIRRYIKISNIKNNIYVTKIYVALFFLRHHYQRWPSKHPVDVPRVRFASVSSCLTLNIQEVMPEHTASITMLV